MNEYIINKWDDGCACMYRTTSLELWLKEIKKLMKKDRINPKYSKYFVHKYSDKKITFFSYAKGHSCAMWKEQTYNKEPHDLFYGIPEGVQYV